MKNLIIACVTSCLLFFCHQARAADTTDVRWLMKQQRLDDHTVMISILGKVGPQVKLYAIQDNDNAALYSTLTFDSSIQKYMQGKPRIIGMAKAEKDLAVDALVSFYTDSVLLQQPFRIGVSDSIMLNARVSYMYKKEGVFVPAEKELTLTIRPPDHQLVQASATNSIAEKSLLWIFLTAFGGGLLALLTPCVYSMLPVTVSFFTKRSKTRKEGIRNALLYSASIIVIFTLLGFLVTFIFGPAALNKLATNWIANLVFFFLFLLFGISFLGAFEISLPSSWSTKADRKAGTGNFMGIFFMALTLALVSFSCTGPIIGNLLVMAARGSYWGPLTGMFAFSLALALPFALFAFFPSKLNVLGKAGGWLNAVKVALGFLELALALKFLSNADLAKGWRLLDREVFLAAWIVIFALLGIYLLGKLKLHHDDELPANDFGHPFLGVKRLFFAMASLIFAVYMVPGLWGAPLKAISAFVPPMGTQDFNASSISKVNAVDEKPVQEQGQLSHPLKYYEQMKIYEPEVVTQYGMVTYFDYKEALDAARKLKKPLMLDFTGINCVNCRKMEGKVWSDPEVMRRLKNDFVIASLYVDAHNIRIPENEQFYSGTLNQQVVTLGEKNADMQVVKFGANTQPYYFFIDGNENKLIEDGYGYDPGIEKFKQLLDRVFIEYKKRNG